MATARVIGTMLHFVLKAIAIVLQAILTIVGTAIAFALKLIEVLISKEKAEEIAASIIYSV